MTGEEEEGGWQALLVPSILPPSPSAPAHVGCAYIVEGKQKLKNKLLEVVSPDLYKLDSRYSANK